MSGLGVLTMKRLWGVMFGAAELEEARTKTARSIALAMLIVIMDMSGVSGSLTTEQLVKAEEKVVGS